jgi:hypothetical protein
LLTQVCAIDHARNVLANEFVSTTDSSHLFFIEDEMGFNIAELASMFAWRARDVVAAMYPKGVIDWAGVKKAVLDHPDIDPIALSHVAGDYTGMFHLLDDASTMTVGRRLRW